MSNDEQLTPASLTALRARFEAQSRKAQAYYTVMHEIKAIVGNDDAANDWMNAPLAACGNQSPAALVGAGREHEVLDYIRTLKKTKPAK